MKTTIALLVVVLGTAFAARSFGAPPVQPALSHPVGSVQKSEADTVQRGSSMVEVMRNLGEPARKLSANVWVYPRYYGGAAHPASDDCSVLLITFSDGTVTDLQLVNARAEIIVAQQLKQADSPALIAKKSE